MKILVGCKVVPEEQDIAVNGETLELSKANPKISQFDLNALQAAVDIKEQNADANIKVLSIGGKSLENTKVRKDILSRGADELVVISSDKFENLLPCDTAEMFKQTASNLGFDLIICGDGSGDLFAGQTGLRVGALLDIPAINCVNKIVSVDATKIVVQRELICVSTDINTPAIPGMKAILAAAKKPVNVMDSNFDLSSVVELKEVKAPKKKDRLKVIVEGDGDDKVAEFAANFKKALN